MNWPDERSARHAIASAAREIYERKLSGASDGNLSVRIGADRLVTTPSGVHKGRLTPDDLLVVDLAGRPIGRVPQRHGKPLMVRPARRLDADRLTRRQDSGVQVVQAFVREAGEAERPRLGGAGGDCRIGGRERLCILLGLQERAAAKGGS